MHEFRSFVLNRRNIGWRGCRIDGVCPPVCTQRPMEAGMRLQDLMKQPVETVSPDTTIHVATGPMERLNAHHPHIERNVKPVRSGRRHRDTAAHKPQHLRGQRKIAFKLPRKLSSCVNPVSKQRDVIHKPAALSKKRAVCSQVVPAQPTPAWPLPSQCVDPAAASPGRSRRGCLSSCSDGESQQLGSRIVSRKGARRL